MHCWRFDHEEMRCTERSCVVGKLTLLIRSGFHLRSPSTRTLCFAHHCCRGNCHIDPYMDITPSFKLGWGRVCICMWNGLGEHFRNTEESQNYFSQQNNTVCLWPMAPICLSPPIFVNKVLWEHSCVYLFAFCQQPCSCYSGRAE